MMMRFQFVDKSIDPSNKNIQRDSKNCNYIDTEINRLTVLADKSGSSIWMGVALLNNALTLLLQSCQDPSRRSTVRGRGANPEGRIHNNNNHLEYYRDNWIKHPRIEIHHFKYICVVICSNFIHQLKRINLITAFLRYNFYEANVQNIANDMLNILLLYLYHRYKIYPRGEGSGSILEGAVYKGNMFEGLC